MKTGLYPKKTVSWPLENPALLTIDLQKDYFKRYNEHSKIVPNVKKLADTCRENDIPIFHILTIHKKDGNNWPKLDKIHDRIYCIEGTEGAQEIDELRNPADICIEKSKFSAFYETNIERELNKRGIKTLMITGLLTHCCVEATVFDAYQRGYNIILVRDGISSYRKDIHDILFSDGGFFENSLGEVATSEDLIRRIRE